MHSDTRSCRVTRPGLSTALALAVFAMCAIPVGAQDSIIPPPARVDPTSPIVARPVGGLRPGDLLKIAVYRQPELSGDYLIDSQGNVQIPGAGIIRAAGLEPHQLHARLVSTLDARGFREPELSVQALVRVSVLGEVRAPALYPVEPGTSLLQLLTLAGGPNERADLRRTRVVREGRSFTVDLQSGLAGSPAGRIVVYSNDLVVIPKRRGFNREAFALGLNTLSTILGVAILIVTLRRT